MECKWLPTTGANKHANGCGSPLSFVQEAEKKKKQHKGSIWEMGHWDRDVGMFYLAVPSESLAN